MILVNGADGIGTGWSTKIPAHNPITVTECVRAVMRGASDDELPTLQPWYRGFDGTIEERPGSKGQIFETRGLIEFGKKKHTVEITELPIGTWTEDYKEWLEQQTSDSKKTGIKSFKNNSTEATVHFTITIATDANARCKIASAYRDRDAETLTEQLKLVSTLSYKNMNTFGVDGAIHHFRHPYEIIRAFVGVRAQVYETRRQAIISSLRALCRNLSETMRFLQLVIDGTLELRNVPKKQIEAQLRKHSFVAPFDPYLNMPLWSITKEKVESLRKRCETHAAELKRVSHATGNDLWEEDLKTISQTSLVDILA